MKPFRLAAAAAALASFVPFASQAQDNVLNLYSARHYQTDEALYTNFTNATGIRINRIEAGDEQLIERLKSEGTNSPADVLLIVDASRLYNAQQLGVFQPVRSAALDSRIPASMRDPNGEWFGFSSRRAVLRLQQGAAQAVRHRDLRVARRPEAQGQDLRALGRASVQPVAGRVDDHARRRGEDRAVGEGRRREPRAPAQGRRPRPDQGGGGRRVRRRDRQQLLLRARAALDQGPRTARSRRRRRSCGRTRQASGTHVNISGAGVLKHAPHKDAAVRFLEYLASDEAQRYFADGNNEWPAVKSVVVKNPALDAMGEFKADEVSIAALGKNTPARRSSSTARAGAENP
jgi:iron(III) transport system substrate-binding protein